MINLTETSATELLASLSQFLGLLSQETLSSRAEQVRLYYFCILQQCQLPVIDAVDFDSIAKMGQCFSSGATVATPTLVEFFYSSVGRFTVDIRCSEDVKHEKEKVIEEDFINLSDVSSKCLVVSRGSECLAETCTASSDVHPAIIINQTFKLGNQCPH